MMNGAIPTSKPPLAPPVCVGSYVSYSERRPSPEVADGQAGTFLRPMAGETGGPSAPPGHGSTGSGSPCAPRKRLPLSGEDRARTGRGTRRDRLPMRPPARWAPLLSVMATVVVAVRAFAIDPCAAVPCTTPGGPFQCYEVKPRAFPLTPVSVHDQFGTLSYSLRFPHRLCFPLESDPGTTGSEATTTSAPQDLMGYTLRTSFRGSRNRLVVNQFGSVMLDVSRPTLLLAPTAASLVTPPGPLGPPALGHFQCYRVKPSRRTAPFAPILGVQVADELETVVVDLLKPTGLCTPASVNDEDTTAPAQAPDLLCYRTRSSTTFGDVNLLIRNELESNRATLIHRRELCVPSLVVPSTTTTTTSVPPTTTITSTTILPTTTTTTSTSTTTTSTATTLTTTTTST